MKTTNEKIVTEVNAFIAEIEARPDVLPNEGNACRNLRGAALLLVESDMERTAKETPPEQPVAVSIPTPPAE